MQAIASINKGILSLQINAQMYETSLVQGVSSFIQNEAQNILVSSIIVNESNVIQKNNFYLF